MKNQLIKGISVLYVRTNSIYKNLVYDTWDINRDADKYEGNNVLISHPPCKFNH